MGLQKGQTNNPHGRPKKEEALTQILKDLGDNNFIDYEGSKKTWKEALMIKMWKLALDGDRPCMMHIYDRYEGRPKEAVHHDVEGIEIKLVKASEADNVKQLNNK